MRWPDELVNCSTSPLLKTNDALATIHKRCLIGFRINYSFLALQWPVSRSDFWPVFVHSCTKFGDDHGTAKKHKLVTSRRRWMIMRWPSELSPLLSIFYLPLLLYPKFGILFQPGRQRSLKLTWTGKKQIPSYSGVNLPIAAEPSFKTVLTSSRTYASSVM
jgi:hypothetical protein